MMGSTEVLMYSSKNRKKRGKNSPLQSSEAGGVVYGGRAGVVGGSYHLCLISVGGDGGGGLHDSCRRLVASVVADKEWESEEHTLIYFPIKVQYRVRSAFLF